MKGLVWSGTLESVSDMNSAGLGLAGLGWRLIGSRSDKDSGKVKYPGTFNVARIWLWPTGGIG